MANNNTRQPETIREAYEKASSFLAGHGLQDHSFIAEYLLRQLLDVDRARFFLGWNEPFPEQKRVQWKEWIHRKAQGEPVQYIVGEQEFFGLPFEVNRAVLIPRPETELLVEQVLQYSERIWGHNKEKSQRLRVLDIGTGSGAIPIALAVHRPNWEIYTTDISRQAIAVAKRNAERNGVEQRIHFHEGDLFEPFDKEGEDQEAAHRFHIVVSNPPYIPSEEILTLQPEVRDYEPKRALDGGTDGFDFYRRIASGLIGFLHREAYVVAFEAGMGQSSTVKEILRTNLPAPDGIEIYNDYAGIDRMIIAWKQQIY